MRWRRRSGVQASMADRWVRSDGSRWSSKSPADGEGPASTGCDPVMESTHPGMMTGPWTGIIQCTLANGVPAM